MNGKLAKEGIGATKGRLTNLIGQRRTRGIVMVMVTVIILYYYVYVCGLEIVVSTLSLLMVNW